MTSREIVMAHIFDARNEWRRRVRRGDCKAVTETYRARIPKLVNRLQALPKITRSHQTEVIRLLQP